MAFATIIEFAIQYAPTMIADLQRLFASGNPTPADYAALRAQVSAETYAQFVPGSDLPKAELAAEEASAATGN